MNNEMIVLIGVPGSGKSTYANNLLAEGKNLNYVKISRDDIRYSIRNSYVVDEEMENLVSSIQDAMIKSALSKKKNIILDNTHCKRKYVVELIEKYGDKCRIILKVIGADLSVKEIKSRNLQRDKVVPESVIDRMYKSFVITVNSKKELEQLIIAKQSKLSTEITLVQNSSLPKAIIVDIDGTSTLGPNNRSPYDWSKVISDIPDENVLRIVRSLSLQGYNVVFLSGRDSVCRKDTIDWLDVYYGLPYELFMRPEGDGRKDSIVKLELYNDNIRDKYYVEAVFDDRNQVVNMWRNELGLRCLQVREGDF